MSDNYEAYYEEDEGIHFGPSDEELINAYLIPKLVGNNLHDDFIVEKNVYTREPWLLDHHMDPFFKQNEWYYFVTRTKVSKDKTGCGKKAKRKIAGDNNDGIERGNWKANTTGEIKDSKTGKVIGKKQNLTYTRSNKNKKHKGGDGTCVVVPGSNDSWIMTEYMLPEGYKFQERVLCKISTIKRSKNKDEASTSSTNDHEASTSTSASTYHHESSTSEQQPISDHDSSSHQEQPLLCGPEIPRIVSLSSLTFPAAEKEKNIEPSCEGKFVSLMMEMVPEISSEKDGQVKDGEVPHELKEDWIGDMMDTYEEKGLEGVLKINTKDEQPRQVFAPTHMNAPLASFGEESLPIELDEWEQELDDAFSALTQDREEKV